MFEISFGALCPSIEEQLAAHGFHIPDEANLKSLERAKKDCCFMKINGYLSAAEAGKAQKRIYRDIWKHAKPIEQSEGES